MYQGIERLGINMAILFKRIVSFLFIGKLCTFDLLFNVK